MNIFNLRPRDVPSGINEYSQNELRIALPDAGKTLRVNRQKAFNMLEADMTLFRDKSDAGELDLNVGTQIIIEEAHWPLAAWMINWFRCHGYNMAISIVTQTGLYLFQDVSNNIVPSKEQGE